MKNKLNTDKKTKGVRAPKYVKTGQWKGYDNPVWHRKDKKKVTILYNLIERRKSYFFQAFLKRSGYNFIDLGDHVKEDVRWGKEYGNRMECNPMYFTSGSIIRNLIKIHEETGLSKDEIVNKYVFLGGGGQCGPCRYGMYPQEYLKVLNDAGFINFRILVFTSDLIKESSELKSAFSFNLNFRINILITIVLADIMHIAECALRPYAKNKEEALKVLEEAEKILLKAYMSRFYLFKIPRALKKVGRMFAKVEKYKTELPLIYVTGEFFANLAHNDGNYNLRRFIMDDGCEVIPGLFTQRTLYDNWRRSQEAYRGIKYAESRKEKKEWKSSLRRQNLSTYVINLFYSKYVKALNPESFGGKTELMDLDELARIGHNYYHPEIFGGEGNLEIAEAIHYAETVDGFISSKPFGCMPSSGVSDGVQSKVLSMYPNLNFLSIETSGDNEVSILSRVSMLILKAKQIKSSKIQ
jgi:predicted nucleotide-binding protein (sugar kinase/HSP70/actin superfamily)